jgi:hypothetical protein
MSSQVLWSSASVSFVTVHEWMHGHGILRAGHQAFFGTMFYVLVHRHSLRLSLLAVRSGLPPTMFCCPLSGSRHDSTRLSLHHHKPQVKIKKKNIRA